MQNNLRMKTVQEPMIKDAEPNKYVLEAVKSRDTSTLTRDIDIAILSVCSSVRPSVRLSVRHTLVLCRNGSTYRQTVFTAW